MTMEQDLANIEAHDRLLELVKSVDPKVAKIQANRDIKVARAKSMTDETRMFRNGAVAVVFILVCVSGCSAYVFGGPENTQLQMEKERSTQARYTQCIEKNGDWNSARGDCDLPDN